MLLFSGFFGERIVKRGWRRDAGCGEAVGETVFLLLRGVSGGVLCRLGFEGGLVGDPPAWAVKKKLLLPGNWWGCD